MAWEDLKLSVASEENDPRILVWRKLRSGALQNYRDILVALPPSYEAEAKSYPLVVMHDGQNLFDPATSYAGDWGLVAALRELAASGIAAIVVGIANKGPFRKYEYSPFRDPVHGGGDGDRYLDFIVDGVLPLVRESFRAGDAPASTAIAGSSMGGLVSLYALYRRPLVFGAAAAMSPSAWFAGEAIRRMVETSEPPAGRIWLDIGTGEGEQMVESARRLRDALAGKGLVEGPRFQYYEDPGAEHNEACWGNRFRLVLPFLLGSQVGDRMGGSADTLAADRSKIPSDHPTIRPSD